MRAQILSMLKPVDSAAADGGGGTVIKNGGWIIEGNERKE